MSISSNPRPAIRPGYANFTIDDPPLKLVLNRPRNGPSGSINHLGVEVGSTCEVTAVGTRLDAGRHVSAPIRRMARNA